MKKLITAIAVIAASVCIAAPHHSHAPHGARVVHRGPAPRPAPMPHHHHHHSFWGRGGSHFWPGFAGGIVGSLFAPAVVPPPPPPPPVVLVNPVWVPPVYGTRPVYDAYGRVVRYEQYIITQGYWR